MKNIRGVQPPAQVPEGFLWLGQVGRPHGVRGAFFLKSEDNRTDWSGYPELVIQTRQEEKIYKVEKCYVSGGKLAVQVQGIADRSACEALYNAHIFVARGNIDTGEDEYLVGDLIGCRVQVEGREGIFGEVVAIHNFGAQETLEIRTSAERETVLYPFLDDFVISVDSEEKVVTVRDEPAFLDGNNS